MNRPIQEVVAATGTTSRTLRHYDRIGLLEPSHVGPGGVRHYDRDALVRLQRSLLLRELGLGLSEIAQVLEEQTDVRSALREHVLRLRQEQDRIGRRAASVERTLAALADGRELAMETMFDGFDHAQYEDEVRERWGDQAWENGNDWWNGLSAQERQDLTERSDSVNGDLRRAAESDLAPDDPGFQRAIAAHHAWLETVPGPECGREGYLRLGDMYVADERFAANYGGVEGARRVREAMAVWAEHNL